MIFLRTTVISMAMWTMVLSGHGVAEGGGSLGVNFGRQTSQKLLPSMVVDMCLANNITKVKFFSVNEGVLSAFARTSIEIYMSVANVDILTVNSSSKAMNWVKGNLSHYIHDMQINIRYVTVTVEPFSLIETDRGDLTFIYQLAQNIKLVQDAITAQKLGGQVKVTIPHATDILTDFAKPSEAKFRKDTKPYLIDSIKVLQMNGDPFTINIYPFHHCINESYPIEFGLFDKRHNISIKDINATYTNMFDFKYDAVRWALIKEGFGNMEIIVGQVGWPTDGAAGANVKNAKRFYDGFLKKIANDEGTPLHPGTKINAYAYSLADENQRSIKRGPYERHYGIYNYDGTPKFDMDFTLQSKKDIKLATAKGVTYLPQRWCVLNKTAASERPDDMQIQFHNACNGGDCSAILNGSSCGDLDELDKVSYAFNNVFQMSNQEMSENTDSCWFEGFGMIVLEEPRIGNCSFGIQILSTLFINALSTGEMQATLGIKRSAQQRVQFDFGVINMLPLFLCFYLLFCITSKQKRY